MSSHQPVYPLLADREVSVATQQDGLRFQRAMHFPAYYATKLSVEHTYEGHSGCVNRLAWNADGSLLVSGSDDRRAIIWHYPEVDRTPWALTTEHRANIFGCQFLPCTGDRRIVTGAMDNSVQLHDLEASPAAGPAGGGHSHGAGGRQGAGGAQQPIRRQVASTNLRVVTPRTKVYLGHKDRVKDVKVEPMNPHNFWSAGEDGVVRQYDTRAPNQDKIESPTVLIQVRDGHKPIQVKSIDINKAHPHLMAVVGSDPYIRMYDRRKLSTGCGRARGTTPTVLALAPPHMPLMPHARHGRSHATYVAFSNRGDKVVTTYHGDHAYSFDITSSGDMAGMFPQPPLGRSRGPATGLRRKMAGSAGALDGTQTGGGRAGGSSAGGAGAADSPGGRSSTALPPRAEEAKTRGNAAVFERKWSAAVDAFTDALHFAPGAPVLYALRAEVLLRRSWVGDAAMALRDCDTAAALDESCSRAFLSRIHALQALQQYQCALTAVDEYRRRFPGRAADDVANLAAQLRAAVEERRRLYEARRQQQERRRVQRTEALARAPRRVAPSASRSPGPPNPGTASLAAAASADAAASPSPCPVADHAATSSAADAGPPAPAAAPSRHDTSEAAAAAAVAEAAAAVEAAGSSPEAVAAGPAAAAASPLGPGDVARGKAASALADEGPSSSAPLHNGTECSSCGCRGPHADPKPSAADAEDPELDSESLAEVYGPPPPPPPLPPEEVSAASPAAGEVGPSVLPASEAVPVVPDINPGGTTAATAASARTAVVSGLGGLLSELGAVMASGEGSDEPLVGPVIFDDEVMESVMEEDEIAAGAAEAEVGPAAMEADGDEAFEDAREGEQADADDAVEEEEATEEEEAAIPRLRTFSDSSAESEPASWGGACEEEDPDLELFLQFYARSLELVEGSGPSASTARSPGRPAGHGVGVAADRGPRHVPGAWGGSAGGRRMLQRYVGQCNVQTDIKEVCFIGADDRLVAAGSDCGRVFLYDADTGAVLRALAADEDVANCVQCHPVLPVLATSGIENVVRLWSPRDSMPAPAAVAELREELAAVVERNQDRMKEGPTVFRPSALQEALQENPQLWHLLMNQLYGRGFVPARGNRGAGGGGGEDEAEEEDEDAAPEVSCRMA